MKLLNQIIDDLVDNEISLDSALLKTKVLANRIQNIELLNWVNKELAGYETEDQLPKYRSDLVSHLRGTYINGRAKFSDQLIPTSGLDKELENSLTFSNFKESINELENLINTDNQLIGVPIPRGLLQIIEENWIDMGNPYLQLINANKVISKTVVVSIISKVRNKLLDFILEINQQFGNEIEISDLKNYTEQVTTIMNKTIINNTGDGNVVNTGDNSNLSVKNKITKGDKAELKRKLIENEISEEDISDLLDVIDTEQPDFQNKKFGVKVNTWTSKMLNKALDGSWNIAIGSAGTLLAEGIKAYYGM